MSSSCRSPAHILLPSRMAARSIPMSQRKGTPDQIRDCARPIPTGQTDSDKVYRNHSASHQKPSKEWHQRTARGAYRSVHVLEISSLEDQIECHSRHLRHRARALMRTCASRTTLAPVHHSRPTSKALVSLLDSRKTLCRSIDIVRVFVGMMNKSLFPKCFFYFILARIFAHCQ